METYEVVFTPKLTDVRLGGIVSAAGKKVAVIVYTHPSDAEFDFTAVTPAPKLTRRKLKNRRHRQNKAGRAVIAGGDYRFVAK